MPGKKTTTRSKNQAFPYSAATRERILKTFKVGQRVRAALKGAVVGGVVTRVARTGWLYVKLAGRKSPTKVDPTKWAPGAAPKAGAKKPTVTPAKKPAIKKPAVKKPPIKKPPKPAVPVKARVVAGAADGVATTPAPAIKPKRVRARKKKKVAEALAPASADSVAEHMVQGGGVAPESETSPARPTRTPVRVPEEHTEELN